MDAFEFMTRFGELAGETAPMVLFSAYRISEQFEISPYMSRKIVSDLRSAGLVRRVGNQYIFNAYGLEICKQLAMARGDVF